MSTMVAAMKLTAVIIFCLNIGYTQMMFATTTHASDTITTNERIRQQQQQPQSGNQLAQPLRAMSLLQPQSTFTSAENMPGFANDNDDVAADDDVHHDDNQYHGDDTELTPRAWNVGPSFDLAATRNVTALVGKTAYLNCRIRNLGNRTVTWIRHRDLHLLTVAQTTYTPDQRFVSVFNGQLGDWTLQVRQPQRRDSGVYECQVSTTPPVGYAMTLSVVEPITTIHDGSPDLYIDTGSTVNLTCIVRHLPEPPAVIQWTHNGQDINYDSPRGGVSVITEKGEISTSFLLIQRARVSDSGQYMCVPTLANPQSVNVHVLNGEEPAAIQRGSQVTDMPSLWVAAGIVVFVLMGALHVP